MHNVGERGKTGNRARRSRLLGNKAPEGTFFSLDRCISSFQDQYASLSKMKAGAETLNFPITYPCPINFCVGHVQNEGTPLQGLMQLEFPSNPRPPTPRSTLTAVANVCTTTPKHCHKSQTVRPVHDGSGGCCRSCCRQSRGGSDGVVLTETKQSRLKSVEVKWWTDTKNEKEERRMGHSSSATIGRRTDSDGRAGQ